MTNDIDPTTGLAVLPVGHFFRVRQGEDETYSYYKDSYYLSIRKKRSFLGIPLGSKFITHSTIHNDEYGHLITTETQLTKEDIRLAAETMAARFYEEREAEEAERKRRNAHIAANAALLGDYPPKSVL